MKPGHPAKRNLVPAWVGGLGRRLFEQVPIAPLVLFRVFFGGIMLWEVYRFFHHDWIKRYYIEPAFLFKYHGFEWVRPFAGDWMYVHFAVLGVAAACVLLGFCYRVAAALFFLGITYVFLLDQTNYLNHLYLVCILSFIMIFVPAHRALSLDAALRPRLRSSMAPTWALWLLRFQIAVPYIGGAIAKLNADWLLEAQPMRTWLAERTDFPVVGRFFTEPWMAYFMSWSGFLFDLLFVPLMLWRRTRLFAFAFAFVFHLTNFRLFNIGIFPWVMLAASVIYFPPEKLGRVLRPVLRWRPDSPEALGAPAPAITIGGRERAILFALALFAAVQILMPFRHILYPGRVSWTEEGHNFSWHMKLRDKSAKVRILIENLDDGSNRLVRLKDYLTSRQARKMGTRPDMLLQFVHHLDALEKAAGRPNVAIRAHVLVNLNHRSPQLLIDPRVDLSRERRTLMPNRFVRPLEPAH